jgi:hypothetical protein
MGNGLENDHVPENEVCGLVERQMSKNRTCREATVRRRGSKVVA